MQVKNIRGHFYRTYFHAISNSSPSMKKTEIFNSFLCSFVLHAVEFQKPHCKLETIETKLSQVFLAAASGP